MFDIIEKNPSAEIEVDLSEQKITMLATGESESFDINDYKKNNITNGFDDIDYLLNIKENIQEFAKTRPI